MSKVIRTCIGISEWTGEYWCDSCGRRIPQVTTVNGMDFCPKCYQETFGERDKDKKIAELKQQLTDKDKMIEELLEKQSLLNRDNIIIVKQLDDPTCYVSLEEYEQKLSKKDKEIEELKANQTPTRKKLSPKNWDKYNLADKLRYRNSQVKEALIRMSDMNEMEDVLRSQLTEKDKEIETLRFTQEQMIKSNKNLHKVFEVFDKQNRHLICKEIREWCEQNEFEVENADQSSDCAVYTYKKLFKKLDQIEKGEINESY